MTLVLISFSLSIMPLDVKSFEINFDNVFNPIDVPIDNAELPSSFTIKTVTSADVIHFNSKSLLLKANALDNPPESWTPLLAGTLTITDSLTETEIKKLSEPELLALFTLEISNNNLEVNLNMNIDALMLPNGAYTAKLDFLNPSLTQAFEYNLHVFKVLPYTSHREATVQNAMKVYYADASSNFLIPVYKPMGSTDKMIRSSLNALLEVPVGYGLKEPPLAPRISRADFTGGVTKCSLMTRDLSENMTNQETALAFLSIAKTLYEVKSSYVINQVEFILDGNSNTVYKDLDLSKPYISNKNANAYVPYSTADKILLVPVEVSSNDPNTIVTNIMKALQGSSLPKQLDILLPPKVLLLNSRIEGRTLVLNFNSHFKTLYYKQPALQIMLLDALSLSFSSMDNVDYISLQVEGNVFNGWEDAPIRNPLSPPPLFNLIP
jgi:hypothetical protein